MSALLSIQMLSATGPQGPVLRGVSLEVKPGEVMGLVGESGAGKSTIAKAILRALPASIRITGGHLSFEGQDLLAMPGHAFRDLLGRRIALTPQDPLSSLNPSRRIGAQLCDGLILKKGLSRTDAMQRARALLDEVRIAKGDLVLKQYPHELSGGMRQRILIAQAFALEPQLIIADEPTTALDVTVQKQVLRLIRQLQQRSGTALIFVTHDLGVVAQVCDRMSVLYGGRLLEAGKTADVLASPQHPYTKALLAASPRYDRPDKSLQPIPASVIASLKAEAG
jgi:peptide/nickel transport system ATP-binding protein